jgi:hypothetical protein
MDSNNYISRISDVYLQNLLESSGAVLIEGAKWCGKTQSSLQAANSVVFMQDPDVGPGYLAMADLARCSSPKAYVGKAYGMYRKRQKDIKNGIQINMASRFLVSGSLIKNPVLVYELNINSSWSPIIESKIKFYS